MAKAGRAEVAALHAQLMGAVHGAGLIPMIAVADRSGLLSLMAKARKDGPISAAQIAARGGYHPRYVEELTGCLACAGLLEKQGAGFVLTAAAATLLADPTHPLGVAGWADMIPALYNAVPGVVDAMRSPSATSGVPFSSFVEWGFARGMDRANSPGIRAVYVRKWLAQLAGWPDRLRSSPTRVADVGCGGGAVSLSVAAAFPLAKVTGYDIDEPSLAVAKRGCVSAGLANCGFVRSGIEQLPEAAFDLVLNHDCIHDLARPVEALRAIRRSLRPDGVFFSAEPACGDSLDENLKVAARSPQLAAGKAFGYSMSMMHCMTVSLANGGDAVGLGSATFGPRTYEAIAREAGFTSFRKIFSNGFNNFYELSQPTSRPGRM